MRANAHKWGESHEWNIALARDFYLGVFDSGNPNPTGLISENAYVNKMNKGKTTHDHCLSPQFVGRMILDNQDTYLNDYEKFKSAFWYSCRTIIVTSGENDALSSLTKNDDNGYKVLVPTNMKYNHLGIKLYQREDGKKEWKYSRPTFKNVLDVPEELLEYEKRFLV
jgi:hypothetical protein